MTRAVSLVLSVVLFTACHDRPLARPLFIYVNVARTDRAEVKAFARYLLRKVCELAIDAARSR